MQVWLFPVVIVTAICVAVDASRLGATRGGLGGGLLDMGPASWFFACLLLWIVALPCYLATRPKLVRRARVLASHPQFTGQASRPVVPVAGADERLQLSAGLVRTESALSKCPNTGGAAGWVLPEPGRAWHTLVGRRELGTAGHVKRSRSPEAGPS